MDLISSYDSYVNIESSVQADDYVIIVNNNYVVFEENLINDNEENFFCNEEMIDDVNIDDNSSDNNEDVSECDNEDDSVCNSSYGNYGFDMNELSLLSEDMAGEKENNFPVVFRNKKKIMFR